MAAGASIRKVMQHPLHMLASEVPKRQTAQIVDTRPIQLPVSSTGILECAAKVSTPLSGDRDGCCLPP